MEGPEGTFAPNLIVTVNPYDGVIDDLLDRAVHGLTTTLQKPYHFDVRIWDKGLGVDASEPGSSSDTVDVSAMGRTIAHAHESPQTGATLRSAEWLFIDQGLAVQVTGTTTAAQWPVFFRALESMARSLSTRWKAHNERSPARILPRHRYRRPVGGPFTTTGSGWDRRHPALRL